jgi:ABC-2 type transport system permease protein
MSLSRIHAVILRQWYEFINQWSRIVDTFFWPIIDLLLWGLTFFYIESTVEGVSLSKVIIGALIFSSFLYSVQRDFTMGFLQEIWDRNLYNVFATPLRKSEIIIGSSVTTIIKTMMLSVIMTAAAYGFYGFNFLEFLPLAFGGIFTITIFGIMFGLLTTAFIFRFGSQVQTLTWSGLGILMPLMCIYYPISALPESFQYLAHALPPAWVFESVRAFVNTQTIPSGLDWLWPNLLNVFYMFLAYWYFNYAYNHAQRRGWFVKMD